MGEKKSDHKQTFPDARRKKHLQVYLIWGTKDKLANYSVCFPKWYSILSCKDTSLIPAGIYDKINEYSPTLSPYEEDNSEEKHPCNIEGSYIYSPPNIKPQNNLWGRWLMGIFHVVTCFVFYKYWKINLRFCDIHCRDIKEEEKIKQKRRDILEKKVTELDLQYLRENSFSSKNKQQKNVHKKKSSSDLLSKLESIEEDDFFEYDIVEGGGHNILLTNLFVSEQISKFILTKL